MVDKNFTLSRRLGYRQVRPPEKWADEHIGETAIMFFDELFIIFMNPHYEPEAFNLRTNEFHTAQIREYRGDYEIGEKIES